MTRNEQRDVQMAIHAIADGMVDYAARSISNAIRAAMTKKSQAELMQVAHELQLTNHPEFII